MKRKNILRIGTFISIAMFILIPLLSSPVAAFTLTSIGTSENIEDGPDVSITLPEGEFPRYIPDEPPRTATFKFEYVFIDSTETGQGNYGSDHYAILYIEKTHPEPDSWTLNSGIVHQNPGTQLTPPGLHQVKDTWTQGDYCYWHVYVTIACRTSAEGDWVEDSDNYVVIVD